MPWNPTGTETKPETKTEQVPDKNTDKIMTEHKTTHEPDAAECYQERLSALLDSLPRETASHEFTGSVLRRLPANDTQPVYARPWVLAVAAVLLLTTAVGLLELHHRAQQQEAIERIAEMRAEYLVLEQELEEIKARASQNRVVYLGESNGTEVVLDLARLPDNQSRIEALRLLQAGLLRASSTPGDPAAAGTGDMRTADYRPASTEPVYY